uniref:Reverse transcriptase domain-containing protein n=1 Tax=Tanacetum cinerariifolium TaxID=118510 RepID=A0A699HID9_TANCI|nr:reverse transcriptase domain-containing protein [Tanacetum cinerariifolium]
MSEMAPAPRRSSTEIHNPPPQLAGFRLYGSPIAIIRLVDLKNMGKELFLDPSVQANLYQLSPWMLVLEDEEPQFSHTYEYLIYTPRCKYLVLYTQRVLSLPADALHSAGLSSPLSPTLTESNREVRPYANPRPPCETRLGEEKIQFHETEAGLHSTQPSTAIANALTRSIPKHSQKAKTAREQSETKFQKRKLLEPTEAEKEARSVHDPHKNSQINFCFRKREVQSSAANDDSGREAKSRKIFRIRLEIKNQLVPAITPLIRFSGEIIWPIGQIRLLVTIGDEEHSASAWMNFMVVRSPSPYNGIIGRPGVRKLQAVPSTAYGMLKILVKGGIITLKSSMLVPLECVMVSEPKGSLPVTKSMVEEGIKRNLDIFAWKPTDMTGVPRHIMEHRLNVREGCSSIGRNLEVYVDDLVIKSRMKDEIVRDIEETFKTLREINMKLNPKKCTFGIEERMFLGYKVSTRGLKSIKGPEINYTSMEKLMLALVHASKRLKRYLQAYPIIVATDQPIQQVLSRPEVAGRLQKWNIELGEYAIHYRPRVSVKGQILAIFIVERQEEDSPDTLMTEEAKLPEPWVLFTDRSSCTDGSGAGLILINPEGVEFTYALRFGFDATNNKAEYKDLITGLKIAKQMGVKNLKENVDSRFKAFSIKQVPRSENKKANAFSKIASTSFAHLSKQVLVEELKDNSISTMEVLAVVEEEGDTWMTLIFK